MGRPKIAITMGDPAGIGPEIIIKTLNNLINDSFTISDFLLIGNRDIFNSTILNISMNLPKNIEFIDIPCEISNIKTGIPNLESGKASFLSLEAAFSLAKEQKINAIVTAPTSKEAMNMAGYNFSGQTEVLENFFKNKAEMLFVANDFRVFLLTRHIPLFKVSQTLTQEMIIESIKILNNSLKKDFNINNPQIAICGLNPHSGENGLLGDEEVKTLIPTIKTLNQSGINIEGPFPSDTMWLKAHNALKNKEKQPYDAYVACYHDQGLIPVKLLSWDSTVNTTINLPVIRTSPAHGTAFDITGKNIANSQSMINAIKLAFELSLKTQKTVFI